MAYLGEDIGKLGFGFMRLPRVNGPDSEIDVEESKKLVDRFLEAGFNYFDTARIYNGSEKALKETLVDRHPRESFYLASKNAAWANAKNKEEATNQLKISLETTGAGYFDFYLLHNLGGPRTKIFEKYDMWTWALEMKEKGLIRHLGFSIHGSAKELEDILIAHPEAEFVQLQINYADWEDSVIQSKANYEIARKYNKPVIVMEPVKGGMLATPPQEVIDIFKEAEEASSVASWAIRFAADLEGVITVLSGMSDMDQLNNNIDILKDFKGFSKEQRDVVEVARKKLATYPIVPCTSCNYCTKVCPLNIGIPVSLTALNQYIIYNNKDLAQTTIAWNVVGAGKNKAEACVKCGACEAACPQAINIIKELERVDETLG